MYNSKDFPDASGARIVDNLPDCRRGDSVPKGSTGSTVFFRRVAIIATPLNRQRFCLMSRNSPVSY